MNSAWGTARDQIAVCSLWCFRRFDLAALTLSVRPPRARGRGLGGWVGGCPYDLRALPVGLQAEAEKSFWRASCEADSPLDCRPGVEALTHPVVCFLQRGCDRLGASMSGVMDLVFVWSVPRSTYFPSKPLNRFDIEREKKSQAAARAVFFSTMESDRQTLEQKPTAPLNILFTQASLIEGGVPSKKSQKKIHKSKPTCCFTYTNQA